MDDLENRKNDAILACSSRILEGAKTAGIEIRLVGGVAIYSMCEAFQQVISSGREPFSDIDLATTSEYVERLEGLFRKWGFDQNREVRILFGRHRRVFYTEQSIGIDVYVDKLALCQEIPIRDRLSLDYPTLSCTDLLLSKIQNVSPKAKDLFDLQVLLQHVVQPSVADEFDLNYISRLCGRWSWWRTFKLNLLRLREHCDEVAFGDSEGAQRVLREIETAVDGEKKPLHWKLRNLIGDRVRWYEIVED